VITLAIPTLTRFALAADCVASALAGTRAPDRVLIVDNSGGQCPPIAGAEIILGRQPQSVAKAWNDAVDRTAGAWIVLANDDVTFAPDTLAQLLATAAQQPAAGIVAAIAGQAYSLFALRRAAYDAVGPFDEGFQAAYFEDNDYAHRLERAGWLTAVAPLTAVGHVGSATLKSFDAVGEAGHHETYRYNERRYIRKWGGKPGRERYGQPWDGRPADA
jgi:GT2 family glycosyltransferase